MQKICFFFFFSSRRRHTRCSRDWSSDVCSSDLGAGTILHARGAVVGLTSAATIWVVAAIGVALGAAFYWEAAGTTLLVLLVLQGLGRVELFVERQSTESSLTVHASPDPTVLEDLETVVRRTGLTIGRQARDRKSVV